MLKLENILLYIIFAILIFLGIKYNDNIFHYLKSLTLHGFVLLVYRAINIVVISLLCTRLISLTKKVDTQEDTILFKVDKKIYEAVKKIWKSINLL